MDRRRKASFGPLWGVVFTTVDRLGPGPDLDHRSRRRRSHHHRPGERSRHSGRPSFRRRRRRRRSLDNVLAAVLS